MRTTITGIQEAQRANNKAIAALRPEGALGRAVKEGTIAAHRYALGVTHVDTGALRASHRMRFENRGLRGIISIDPASTNPRNRARPYVYGVYEHRRGAGHDFYARTVQEAGPGIARQMGTILRSGLP